MFVSFEHYFDIVFFLFFSVWIVAAPSGESKKQKTKQAKQEAAVHNRLRKQAAIKAEYDRLVEMAAQKEAATRTTPPEQPQQQEGEGRRLRRKHRRQDQVAQPPQDQVAQPPQDQVAQPPLDQVAQPPQDQVAQPPQDQVAQPPTGCSAHCSRRWASAADVYWHSWPARNGGRHDWAAG